MRAWRFERDYSTRSTALRLRPARRHDPLRDRFHDGLVEAEIAVSGTGLAGRRLRRLAAREGDQLAPGRPREIAHDAGNVGERRVRARVLAMVHDERGDLDVLELHVADRLALIAAPARDR